jgi:cysteinyl-tRNA synthetase
LKEDVKTSSGDGECIVRMIEKRNNAKQNKDFATADKIRNDLFEKGIKLIDTKDGTIYDIV